MRWKFAVTPAIAVASVVMLFASAGTAQAGTYYSDTWGAGAYHASADITPPVGGVRLMVKCVGGYQGVSPAKYAYVGLAATGSGSRVGFASYSYPCDAVWHTDSRTNWNSNGQQKVYLQWYGQDRYLTNGYNAVSAGAGVYR